MRHARRTAVLILALAPGCAVGAEGPLDESQPGTVLQSHDAAPSQDVASEAQGPTGRDDSGSSPPPGDDAGPSTPEAGEDSSPPGNEGGPSSGDDAGMPEMDAGTLDAAVDSAADAPSMAPETGPPPGRDSGSSTCAGPTTPAGCHACTPSSNPSCQPNGCFNGYVCNTTTNRCGAPGTCS